MQMREIVAFIAFGDVSTRARILRSRVFFDRRRYLYAHINYSLPRRL